MVAQDTLGLVKQASDSAKEADAAAAAAAAASAAASQGSSGPKGQAPGSKRRSSFAGFRTTAPAPAPSQVTMADQSTAAPNSELKTFSDVANAVMSSQQQALGPPALMGRSKQRRMSQTNAALASNSFGAEDKIPTAMERELKQLNSKLASVVAALGSLGQRQERIEGELRTLSNSPKPTIREVRPPYDDDDGGVEA